MLSCGAPVEKSTGNIYFQFVHLTHRLLCWPPKRATTTPGAATTSYRYKPVDIPVSDHGNHACLLLPIFTPKEPASTNAVGSLSNLHPTNYTELTTTLRHERFHRRALLESQAFAPTSTMLHLRDAFMTCKGLLYQKLSTGSHPNNAKRWFHVVVASYGSARPMDTVLVYFAAHYMACRARICRAALLLHVQAPNKAPSELLQCHTLQTLPQPDASPNFTNHNM